MTGTITKRVLLTGAALTAALGIGGVAHAATPQPAPTSVQSSTTSQHPSATSSHQQSSGEQASQENSGEQASHETDGPGGHADANGANVNHQFNGVE